jgi:hypothetical protein
MYHFPTRLEAGCDKAPPAGVAVAPAATGRGLAPRKLLRR